MTSLPDFPAAAFNVTKEITAAYSQLDLRGEGFRGNLGLRYVKTDQTSRGFTAQGSPGNFAPNSIGKDYTDWLPSFNLALEVSPDMTLRLAASRTMARANFADLASFLELLDTVNSGNGGNPDLEPYRASNFDVSGEWYLDEDAVFALTFFYKDIRSFIVRQAADEQHFNILTGQVENYSITRPRNGAGGEIRGAELTYQNTLWGNFGVQANYTFADGGTDEGLEIPFSSKHTVNLTPYYDDRRLNARVTYGWRSKYFREIGRNGVAVTNDEYAQLDIAAGLRLTECIELTADPQSARRDPLRVRRSGEPAARRVQERPALLRRGAIFTVAAGECGSTLAPVKLFSQSSRMSPTRRARFCLILLATATAAAGREGSERAGELRASPGITAVVPQPAEVKPGTGVFVLTSSTPVTFGAGAEAAARDFAELLRLTGGPALALRSAAPESGVVRFTLKGREAELDAEEYVLRIALEGIHVTAPNPRGLFYGAMTLWQLLPLESARAGRMELASVTIEDAPRFLWRGLMLDSARHYQSPQFIKRLIDLMALHKLNILHWHLTDDQGWRLEITQYPKLTEVGAWRVPAGAAAAANIDPGTGGPRRYGGFYSQEEVREIVEHAARRHITIVPEIDMPGHASAAIAAYPALGVRPEAVTAVPADWGVYPNLFNVEESTFVFLENVLEEVMALFPGRFIHLGGDEVLKDQWRDSPRVQARMRELKLADEQALESYFTRRMARFLEARDRRALGWDEILEGDPTAQTAVMSWRGTAGAVTAARMGRQVVLAPAPTLYFDHRPSAGATVPGREPVIDLETVYRFDPAPAELTPAQVRYILGLQGNLWTEHMRTESRVEYMAFPRAAAVAELGWTPGERLSWLDFAARVPGLLARYERLGVRYAASAALAPQGSARTSHELELCSRGLVLSLEDDAPLEGERAVFRADIFNPCWIYPDVDLSQGRRVAVAVGQVPFNFQLGHELERVRLQPSRTAAGELEVHLGGCEGAPVARLDLGSAANDPTVTRLAPITLTPRPGRHDLCFRFTQAQLDPLWVLDAVELQPARTGVH